MIIYCWWFKLGMTIAIDSIIYDPQVWIETTTSYRVWTQMSFDGAISAQSQGVYLGVFSSVVVTRAHGMITPELSIWITRETKFSNFFALPSWGPDLLDGVCGSTLSYPQGMVNEEITCL